MQIRRIPKWVYWCAAALIALQTYFFRELIAAEMLFGIVFGGFLLLVFSIYVVSEAGDRGLGWMEANGREMLGVARRQWGRVEAVSRRTFRRQHSESAR
jgi:hypothetical protein